MWALVTLILLNGIVPKPMLFAYRFDIAGLPINALDVLTVVGFGIACFSGFRDAHERTHPLLWTVIVLFAAAATFGTIGGVAIDAVPRWIATGLRNLVTLPVVIFVSYRLVNSQRRISTQLYAILIASLASAVIGILFVSNSTEDIAAGRTFDTLRTTQLSGDSGCAAAALILFSMVSGIRLFPIFVTLPLLLVAVLGSFSVPHRSVWLVSAVTYVYATLILYRRHVVRKLFLGVTASVLICVAAWIAVSAISTATGHDYGAFIERRLASFLPGGASRKENRPWESRTPGIRRELELWLQNPIMGRGFGIQDIDSAQNPDISGYRHNVWSSSLAEGGPAELAGMLCVVLGSIVIGYRTVKAGGSRKVILFGALASSMGVWGLILATSSMSLNTQATALISGTIFGGLLRVRTLQLAEARALEENPDIPADANDDWRSANASPVPPEAYYDPHYD